MKAPYYLHGPTVWFQKHTARPLPCVSDFSDIR
jgi:hypothetical protein